MCWFLLKILGISMIFGGWGVGWSLVGFGGGGGWSRSKEKRFQQIINTYFQYRWIDINV